MSARGDQRARRLAAAGLLGGHLLLYLAVTALRAAGPQGLHPAAAAYLEGFRPLESFNLLLVAANLGLAVLVARGRAEFLIGAGAMFLIAAHAFVGQFLAPDPLTSGALLMVNLMVLYVGAKVNTLMLARYWYAFAASYLLLFYLFILRLPNAQALFLLSLLGLAACARSLRLLAYFWALVLSFTLCQPYEWEAAILSFFVLTAVFRARGRTDSPAAVAFLACGLVVLSIVLLPIVAALLRESPHNIRLALEEPAVRRAIGTTAWTATVSTLFLLVFAVPLAYAASRLRFPGRTLLLAAVDLPIVVPPMVAGIALAMVFSSNQFLGEAIRRNLGLPIDGTALGVCVAQVFVAMPFLVKAALAAFDAVPERLETAARVLGASSLGAFGRVTVPLAGRGIFLGTILAWARAAGEFGAVYVLAQNPETAPVLIFKRGDAAGFVETGRLVATLLLFSLAIFLVLHLAARALPGAPAAGAEGGAGEEARA